MDADAKPSEADKEKEGKDKDGGKDTPATPTKGKAGSPAERGTVTTPALVQEFGP